MKQLGVSDIRIRDPFVLPVAEEGLYYLFGTTDVNNWDEDFRDGFDCYRSGDLVAWEGPSPAFRPEKDFWATGNFWAPEVHRYRGRFYMFASFKAPGVCRGTQILVSDAPGGAYRPLTKKPVTPAEWECLDGTLWADDAGRPWLVFCHEWVQVGDGEVCALPLTADLAGAAGEARVLFRASEAPWARPVDGGKFVTDGPFLFQEDGKLLMLWSSFGDDGYAMGIAEAADGRVDGRWIQHPEPVFRRDGGHGMLFSTFDGRRMMTLHQPNRSPDERPRFLPWPAGDGGN